MVSREQYKEGSEGWLAQRSRENQRARSDKKLEKRRLKTLTKLDKRIRLIAAHLGRDLSEQQITSEVRTDILRDGYARLGRAYKGKETPQSQHSCAGYVVHCMGLDGTKKRLAKKERKGETKKIKNAKKLLFVQTGDFLKSPEWRKLRYEAITLYGKKCQCCGQEPPAIIINVDHIKPRKKHPELALEITNLQILCHECNHGKGNWDETDWRKG